MPVAIGVLGSRGWFVRDTWPITTNSMLKPCKTASHSIFLFPAILFDLNSTICLSYSSLITLTLNISVYDVFTTFSF